MKDDANTGFKGQLVGPIEESEMQFGPFEETNFCRLEKCEQYLKLQKNMPMTEFVFYNEEKNRLISLEAKKSAPNPNSEKMEHPREKFQEYIQGICRKFENSIDLYSSIALAGRVLQD